MVALNEKYDGMRFSRTDANGTGSFAWNGEVLEAELGAGNTVSAWYTQGMGEYGDIISTRDASADASSLQLYDASGNVNQTTDASANITATLSYDSFGNVTANSGPANPTVAWQGKQGYQFEQPLGLQYVRQRWYDPVTRQFISPDPLGFGGGDVNLFRYAGNNPVNRNDPSGEQFGDDFGQMGGGFSAFGPLVPSAPLQNTLGVQASHAVQRAVIAHMPTHTPAERLAKHEALRSLNAPINVASLGHLAAALVGFPFALAYEAGKTSYHHAVANTTILATRHIEHGGSAIGAGLEAVAYNILSWFGIKSILEGGAGTTLVNPQRLSTGGRFLRVGSGALQFVIVAAPEIKEFLPGIGGTAPADTAALRSFRLGGHDYVQLREALRGVAGVLREVPAGERLAPSGEGAIRWFYDPRDFRIISKEYWGGTAGERQLDHWLISQDLARQYPILRGFANAKFNLLDMGPNRWVTSGSLGRLITGGKGMGLPLNTWLGFAENWGTASRFRAIIVRGGVRGAVIVPTVGGIYGGYKLGQYIERPGISSGGR